MFVSIVTINFNSSENTLKLLESLKNQTDKDFDIFLIENNSNPEQKLMLKNGLPQLDNLNLIENEENFGFSGGNNIGIQKALGGAAEWIVLLNNDTVVEPSFVESLKAALEDRLGVAGITIEEHSQVSYAGKISWLRPTLEHIRDSSDDNSHYIIGGGLAIQRGVFDIVGLLDENYFLYFEDADWTLRVRKAGYPVAFLKEVKIRHSVSTSTKKMGSPLLLRYHYRNSLYFNKKNGPWYIKILVYPWSWVISAKQIIKIILGKNKEESTAVLKGVVDWYAGRMGKINT